MIFKHSQNERNKIGDTSEHPHLFSSNKWPRALIRQNARYKLSRARTKDLVPLNYGALYIVNIFYSRMVFSHEEQHVITWHELRIGTFTLSSWKYTAILNRPQAPLIKIKLYHVKLCFL